MERATSETTAWAQMFAQRDKNEGLSKENNVLRGDRDAFRIAFSYWIGFVRGIEMPGLKKSTRQRLDRELKTMGPLLDERPFRQGYRDGRDYRNESARRDGSRFANRTRKVFAEFGIESPQHLREVLAQVAPRQGS